MSKKKKKTNKKRMPNKAQGQKKQALQNTGGNKKLGLVIAAAVVLVLVVGGILAWALSGGNGDAEAEFQLGEDANGEAAANVNGETVDGETVASENGNDAVNGENGAERHEMIAPTEGNPIVTIEMEDGSIIRAELFPDIAPNTVNNFISLVNEGFYDGLIFHRVIPGFMIQGGCPLGAGFGGPGHSIAGEFDAAGFPNPLSHEPGVLSMARSMDPDSAGSQFFIVHGDASFLDGEYASFGRVIEGMDVVERIATTPRDAGDLPDTPQVMQRVTVETFGAEFPAPVVIPD